MNERSVQMLIRKWVQRLAYLLSSNDFILHIKITSIHNLIALRADGCGSEADTPKCQLIHVYKVFDLKLSSSIIPP